MDAGDASEVAARFGLGTVISPPSLAARGANGFIWKVTTDRGAFAVKRMKPWIIDEHRPFDIRVQLAALDAGIALPRPVLARDGATIVDRTRVYEWVDVGAAPATPCTATVAEEVGTILGTIHRLGVPPPDGVDPWYTDPPARARWEDLVRRGVEAGAAWADGIAAEAVYLDEVGRRVSTPATGALVTCHGDLAPGNVLPSVADGRLVVLDWENTGPLPVDAEVAWTLVVWCADHERIDLDSCDALLRAYARAAGAVPAMTPASFHIAVVTHLNFLATNLDHSLGAEHAGEFVDRWIDRLSPGNLRRRMAGIDLLVDAFGQLRSSVSAVRRTLPASSRTGPSTRSNERGTL